jgi:hypothetical protein
MRHLGTATSASLDVQKQPPAKLATAVDFTVTEVTHDRHNPQYYSRHDLLRATVMTRLWRNSLEAVAAVGTIVLGTLLVHLAMTWWSASAGLH